MEMDLLEYIAFETSCQYISDIKAQQDGFMKYKIAACISKIKPHQFSLSDWNDLVWYITDKRVIFCNSSAALEYLLRYLESNE